MTINKNPSRSLRVLLKHLSHDIRRNLGDSYLLLDSLSSRDFGADTNRLYKSASLSIKHSLYIIHAIIKLSNTSGMISREFNLARTLNGLADYVEDEFNSCNITRNHNADLTVKSDEDVIYMLLFNIYKNAYNAQVDNQRKEISCDVKETPLQTDQLERLGRNQKKYSMQDIFYMISIADKGSGMTANDVAKLLDNRQRVRADTKHIGLALRHYIMDYLNGFFEITTKQGEGTTFNIYIPKYDST